MQESANATKTFSQTLVSWQKQHGRHALPWQNTRDAYRIWLSEIMLQQTQVATVIPYYAKFLEVFPDVLSLAAASQQEVMSLWSGLGYYTRARNLHQCARVVAEQHGGVFPTDPAVLETLPGIGRSTAAAIAVFSSGKRAAIMDGNVLRVFSRVFGIDELPTTARGKRHFWHLAESLLPQTDLEAYTQGLMDLGATLCVRSSPNCSQCPFMTDCVAFRENRIGELPAKREKKAQPEKRTVMLVVTDGQKVLFQKRQETGIWGGLYSLPECVWPDGCGLFEPQLAQAIRDAAGPFGRVLRLEYATQFVHVFSHFRLHIAPCIIRLEKAGELPPDSDCLWYSLARIDGAPIPAPVRRILDALG